mmetsp:Transcript_6726/g.18772  ORF Transcript_6726/g.18772 Transcript_6726/m.18772 type:complete len:220 (-) Transcript_6726:1372-2031(-)
MDDESREARFGNMINLCLLRLFIKFRRCHCFEVIHRLHRCSAHPWQTNNRQNRGDEAEGDHVDIISRALLQLIVGVVDYTNADVLIHKEQAGQKNCRECTEQAGLHGYARQWYQKVSAAGKFKSPRNTQSWHLEALDEGHLIDKRHGNDHSNRPEILYRIANLLVKAFAGLERNYFGCGEECEERFRQGNEWHGQITAIRRIDKVSSQRRCSLVNKVET